MISKKNADEKIAGYLRAIEELEHIELNGATPLERLYKGARNFLEIRVREFNWTLLRAAKSAHARLFAEKLAREEALPAWWSARPTIEPQSQPTSTPRILIDMTSTLRVGKATGIQRVVREIARHAWEIGGGIPVALHNGRLLSWYRHPSVPDVIELREGDVFLMPDANWSPTDEYQRFLDEAKAKGARSVACLYDILPLLYPNAFPPDLSGRFRTWLDRIVLRSDGVVADSQAAAESLRDYLAANEISASGLPLGWWRLGADFSPSGAEASAQATRITTGAPYFLTVGTVEPRKGYPILLDAMERLWSEGRDFSYVIVGARGWGMRHFEKRLRRHPEFDRRLFWMPRTGDADLALLYAHARSLALASVAEGFGLPIVEAAHYGTPVIATDIPVFREVAGDGARYFDLLDAESLAAQLREALDNPTPAPNIKHVSWRESAAELIAIARAQTFQSRIV